MPLVVSHRIAQLRRNPPNPKDFEGRRSKGSQYPGTPHFTQPGHSMTLNEQLLVA